jgi:hypothetical protein
MRTSHSITLLLLPDADATQTTQTTQVLAGHTSTSSDDTGHTGDDAGAKKPLPRVSTGGSNISEVAVTRIPSPAANDDCSEAVRRAVVTLHCRKKSARRAILDGVLQLDPDDQQRECSHKERALYAELVRPNLFPFILVSYQAFIFGIPL